MSHSANRISAEVVKKATGKTLEEWFVIINKEGGEKMTHKEIARMLYDKKHIKSGWWCQMVTVQYEYAEKSRVVGKTADAGFEIGVQKTLQISPKSAWKMLISREGVKIWLGDAGSLKLETGKKFKTKDGIEVEIRTVDRGKKIRLKLGTSILQIYLLPSGKYVSSSSKIDTSAKSTSIGFHQEKLSTKSEREEMRKHWQGVLLKLQKLM